MEMPQAFNYLPNYMEDLPVLQASKSLYTTFNLD